MAIINHKRGIALLVAVIFMSVMLSFAAALAALAYKQSVLTSNVTQSQEALYAADAALECALYADQQEGAFIYSDYTSTNLPSLSVIPAACDGTQYPAIGSGAALTPSKRLIVNERISFNNGANCADVTVYKYNPATPLTDPSGKQWQAFIFAAGYNVPCSVIASAANGGRVVVRGLYERY